MKDIITIAIILIIVGLSAYYIYKSKKNGKKCVGCPYSCSCSAKNGCGCSTDVK